MEDEHKILAFANINLTDYLNRTHVTSDFFLIETQKHNLNKYQKQLNEQLHLSFITNSDALLTILDAYQYCYNLLQDYRIPQSVQEETTVNCNKSKCKEFKNACSQLKDDMEPYFTNERFLVKIDYFNEDKYLCILTNDMLFIGEKYNNDKCDDKCGNKCDDKCDDKCGNKCDGKYILKHSFSKNILDITKDTLELIVSVPGCICYNFKNEQSIIDNFYDSFQETLYEYILDIESSESRILDENLIEYYIETEQISALRKYLELLNLPKHFKFNQLKNIKITSKADLIQLFKISEDSISTFNSFVISRFISGLDFINKIKHISELINDTFDYLEKFVEDLERLCKSSNIPKRNFVLLVEKLILAVFDFLEKRIFNKFYQIKITEENLELIKNKLKFQGLDYQYLINNLLHRKNTFSRKCINNAMEEIKSRVDSIFD